MAGVEVVTSQVSLVPNQVNGNVPTSQQSMPPKTPRVYAQPQRPPALTASPRVQVASPASRVSPSVGPVSSPPVNNSPGQRVDFAA